MSTTTSQEALASQSRLPARDRQVIAILLVAAFVVILNETIMSVALPRLMVDLDISARTVQWLTTAFMLTMAVVIPTTGFLLQRVSTRTVFMLAMGLFSAGTLLAALSPGFWLLLLARIVQASGTAVMIPLLMTTVLTLVPADRRGVVMGNISIAISVAPAIGPTLSGLVLQFLSWRFMFVLVLPIALASLVYGSRRLVNVGQPGHQKLDFPSVLLSIPAFGGLVYGLSQLGRGASGPEVAIGFITFGLACMLIFGWRQLRLTRREGSSPLLDLRPFGYPMFSLSLALLCLGMLALFGMVILLPIYLQTIRGIGSLATGLLLLPGGLLMGLAGPTVGKIIDRYGPRLLTIPGAALLTFTLWQFSKADASTPIWMLIGVHMLLMLGLACLFTPSFTAGLNPLPPYLYSHGSALLGTLQQVAGAAGAALLVAIMASRTATLTEAGLPELAALNGGIQTAFGVAALISIAALVMAFFIRNTKPPIDEQSTGHEPGADEEPVAEQPASTRS
ncbi:MAG TPA: DHA2 family efflux MFS transporter permease subunit [Propionibacteriaceae bacterium]|nr:DHA2 family efflux MFS transporter permease subunit [Propionibacteriaceae bacterium]